MENAIVIYTFKTIIQKADVKKMTPFPRSQSGIKRRFRVITRIMPREAQAKITKDGMWRKMFPPYWIRGIAPPQRKNDVFLWKWSAWCTFGAYKTFLHTWFTFAPSGYGPDDVEWLLWSSPERHPPHIYISHRPFSGSKKQHPVRSIRCVLMTIDWYTVCVCVWDFSCNHSI